MRHAKDYLQDAASGGVSVGYARVSTAAQNADLQLDALREVGCDRVFLDQASGALKDRPQLGAALDYLRSGDTLVVWKLDRLGRSLRHLVDTVQELQGRDVNLRSLQEAIDTSTPGGRLVLHVFCSLAEFERDLIRERTQAGLSAARARGRLGGRPVVMTVQKSQAARQLHDEGKLTMSEIAQVVGVSRATLYRHLGVQHHGGRHRQAT